MTQTLSFLWTEHCAKEGCGPVIMEGSSSNLSCLVPESVVCASLSGDSQCILCSSSSSSLRLMDRETGELLAQYSGHNSKNYKVKMHHPPIQKSLLRQQHMV